LDVLHGYHHHRAARTE